MSLTIEGMVCKNCRESAMGLILQAMMMEAGAKIYPNPLECSEDRKHEFVAKEELLKVGN